MTSLNQKNPLALAHQWFRRKFQHEKSHRTEQQEVGAAAEQAAEVWLRKNCRIRTVERNWIYGKGELDLVAKDAEILVFIEVRARQESALVSGYHSITKHKKEVLRRCALEYLKQCRPYPRHFRFDIVEVGLNNLVIRNVRHFKNVPIFRKHDRPTHL